MLGEPLKSYGKVIMEINMGPLYYDHMCVLADIVDEVQLGEDLLLCENDTSAVVRCVTKAENVEVPSVKEQIVGLPSVQV